MVTAKPIETVYRGFRFRSRLEARWAVFFDTLGIKWEYEREGYDLGGTWYLPDFWLPLPTEECPAAGYWFEIKGQEPTPDELSKAQALAMTTRHTTFVAWGPPGEHYLFWAHRNSNTKWADPWLYEGTDLEEFQLWVTMTRWDVSWPVFQRAILTARQARFEHGEHPR